MKGPEAEAPPERGCRFPCGEVMDPHYVSLSGGDSPTCRGGEEEEGLIHLEIIISVYVEYKIAFSSIPQNRSHPGVAHGNSKRTVLFAGDSHY